MTLQKPITTMLEKACPSIQFRIRKELLGQPTRDAEMAVLQRSILKDQAVKKILLTGMALISGEAVLSMARKGLRLGSGS